MSAKNCSLLMLLAAGVSLGALGCSKGVDIPKVVKVTGKVTYKDKPLADAEVGFLSKLDNEDVKAARGVTNAAGEFSLTTYVDAEHEVSGATPGEYKVIINKEDRPSMEEMTKQFTSGTPNMTFKKLVPKQYTAKDSTPLEVTVTLDGDNKFDLPLTD